MAIISGRIAREMQTITVMIGMYCTGVHHLRQICPQCTELLEYALERVEKCTFGSSKTTCVNCPVHCYKAEMRERVRAVMRYAGPRMLLKHPVLALLHLWDGRKRYS